jgi:hypothetical protein
MLIVDWRSAPNNHQLAIDNRQLLVRYYGWYSNKMRGQRAKLTAEEAKAGVVKAVEVIDVSGHKPRRIPSAKWRELIKKVWEADPLLCPRCLHEIRGYG